MTEFGIFLSSEEHGPTDLVRYAQYAELANRARVDIEAAASTARAGAK